MVKRLVRSLPAVCALALVSLPVGAQDYPMPAASGSPPVLCTTCEGTYFNLPTAQYSLPLKRFVGRMLDSNNVRDYQQTPRTLRAKGTWIAPGRNRVYVHFGASRFATYQLSTFFTETLGQPMVLINRAAPGKEKYLPWYGNVDAETAQGWKTIQVDGQDRFMSFDWDDRDFVYLGYGPYGWGVVRDSGPGILPLVKQVKTSAGAIMVLKVAAKYYAVLLQGSSSFIYDVTDPNSLSYDPPTQPLRQVPYTALKYVKASSASGDHLALIDYSTGLLRIWRAADFIVGGPPAATFSPKSGSSFKDVTTDGTNFYAVEATGSSAGYAASISFVEPSGTGFTETKRAIDPFFPFSIRFGSGYLGMVGGLPGGTLDVRLLRLVNSIPQKIELNSFFRDYYYSPPAGYARPGNTIPFQMLVHKHEGKDYLILSSEAMADVYELQSRETIDISIDSTKPWGTKNTFSSRKDDGPFYGDKIPFKSSYNATATTIQWNFDNTEAGSANTKSTSSSFSFTYQYSGLDTEAKITRRKNVTAAEIGDSTNSDSLSFDLLVPLARLGVRNTELLFTQPNASSSAPIVFGDEFVDASDGTVESHSSNWLLDATASTLLPSAPLSVGACGPHAVTLTANYGAGAPFYVATAGPVGYSVKPFVAGIKIGSPTGTTVTFSSATRWSSPSIFVSGTSTAATFKWELLDASNNVVQQTSQASQVGLPSEFLVNKSAIVPGGSVRLTVSVLAGSISEPSCAALTSSTASFPLNPPDPKINDTNCTHMNSGCTLTASSISGADQNGWSYLWTANGSTVGTSKTVGPLTFSSAGTYTIKVVATSAIGAGEATKVFNILPPVCTSYNEVTFSKAILSTSGKQARFTPYAWVNNAPSPFQDCDSFLWNFGDGSPNSTEQIATHTFPGNGPYTVTLTVKNSTNSTTGWTYSDSIQFGSAPPPPPTCSAPTGSITIGHNAPNGSCTGADKTCDTGTAISFTPYFFGGFTPQSCHIFEWSFGDGTGASTQNATHTYASNGTWTVRLTVRNSSGASISADPIIITTTGGQPPPPPGCPTAAPSQFVDFQYVGASTECKESNTIECSHTEMVTITAVSFFGAPLQVCDSFAWDYGDGTTGSGKTVTHVFAGPNKVYTVKLTVSNSLGSRTVARDISFQGVGVAVPANVSIQGSSTAAVNVPTTFTGQATAPESAPVTSWTWDFGDGTEETTTTVPNVTHAFTHTGTFNMSLIARNAGGKSAAAGKVITVSEAASFAFLLPVVVHSGGANNSLWRTDLQIFDPNHVGQAQPLNLSLQFNGQFKNLEVNSSTYIYEDFMRFFVEQGDAAGSVIVRGTAKTVPQLWTRVYNESPDGTFGQLIPAVPLDETIQDLSTTAPAYVIPSARSGAGARYRTNVGLINLSANPIEVTIAAYDEIYGAQIGADITESLNPFQLVQINNLSQRVPVPADRPFSIRISPSGGAPLLAYGSMVDNVSNDPVFIAAVPDSAQANANKRVQVLPAVGHFSSWRTDATIFNADTRGVQFALRYYDGLTGSKQAEAQRTIPGNTFIQLDDVLRSSDINIPGDSLGILVVETLSGGVGRYPIVFARTYSDQGPSGTFGLGITAFASAEANVRPGKPAYVAGFRNDDWYYTNIGLVNVSAEQATVRVSFLDRQTGEVIPIQEITLGSMQSVIGNLFPSQPEPVRSTPSGTFKFEIVSGGSVWAFASLVDRATQDPEYIPAVPTE